MKILVISDSHGNFTALLKAHELAGPVDHIVHLGDGAEDARTMENLLDMRVFRIAGNCDCEPLLPTELTLQFETCTIFLTHGNRYFVKSGLDQLSKKAVDNGINVVLYGHTHQAKVELNSGILYVNPGTLKKGFKQSYAILTINDKNITAEILDI